MLMIILIKMMLMELSVHAEVELEEKVQRTNEPAESESLPAPPSFDEG